MVHGPEVLVLDEPSNALDPAGVVRVRRWSADAADRAPRCWSPATTSTRWHASRTGSPCCTAAAVLGSLDPAGADLERQFFEMVYEEEDDVLGAPHTPGSAA